MKLNKYNGIRNKKTYYDALTRLGDLMDNDPKPKSDEGKELALLATLIENYEDVRFPRK